MTINIVCWYRQVGMRGVERNNPTRLDDDEEVHIVQVHILIHETVVNAVYMYWVCVDYQQTAVMHLYCKCSACFHKRITYYLPTYFMYTAEEQTKKAFERHFETQVNFYHEQVQCVCMCWLTQIMCSSILIPC